MKRLLFAGSFFTFVGIGFLMGGAVVVGIANAGKTSLQAVYQAQHIMMEYDANGNFIDRGTVENGDAILSLLTNDWQYPLKPGSLDPKDPLVNTPDEAMVQYARISYHTLHSTVKVTIDKDAEYKGETFKAGSYDFPINGRYWQDFDRSHPIEGPARSIAWSPTVLGLLSSLQAGFASHTLVELAWYIGILIIGLGMTFFFGGLALGYAGLMGGKK